MTLYEREAIAAGASGRNSGSCSTRWTPVLLPLFTETVAHYRDLAAHGFALPAEPDGLLMLAADEAALGARARRAAAAATPSWRPRRSRPASRRGSSPPWRRASPACACTPATRPARRRDGAFAARAGPPARDGAGAPRARARRATRRRRARRRRDRRRRRRAVDARARRPVAAPGARSCRCGASTSRSACAAPPRHALEEAGSTSWSRRAGEPPPLFSLVTAQGVSSLGSTFLPDEPDAGGARAAAAGARRALRARAGGDADRVGARVRAAAVGGRAAAARPRAGRDDVVVAAGHGAVGHLARPGARRGRVADLVLGREAARRRPAFDPARFWLGAAAPPVFGDAAGLGRRAALYSSGVRGLVLVPGDDHAAVLAACRRCAGRGRRA